MLPLGHDPLDTIASGPTSPDPTTFAHCLELIDRYALRQQLPIQVRRHLEDGCSGLLPETPKCGDPCFALAENCVVGNSSLAIDAACEKARALGYEVIVLTSRLQGEAREAAATLTAIAQEIATADRPAPRRRGAGAHPPRRARGSPQTQDDEASDDDDQNDDLGQAPA